MSGAESCPDELLTSLRSRIKELVEENATLRRLLFNAAERASACAEHAFLARHSTLAAGMKGQRLVAEWVRGTQTTYGDPADVRVGTVEIEVKHCETIDGIGPLRGRWKWAKIFGQSRTKDFDYLVLVGRKHPAFLDRYKDPSSPYVLFCLPRIHVTPLTSPSGKHGDQIGLTCSGRGRAGKASDLWQFEVSVDELEQRFARLRVA